MGCAKKLFMEKKLNISQLMRGYSMIMEQANVIRLPYQTPYFAPLMPETNLSLLLERKTTIYFAGLLYENLKPHTDF